MENVTSNRQSDSATGEMTETDIIQKNICNAIVADLRIEHINNGMIQQSDIEIYGLAEFRASCPLLETLSLKEGEYNKIVFETVNFNCGWFYVDSVRDTLVGPLKFDATKYMETGDRMIKFRETREELKGLSDELVPFVKIINIDDNPEYLIDQQDIPYWMMRDLKNSIDISSSALP
jgi:hypothetical protein